MALEIYEGNLHEVNLPSGGVVEIREHSAMDDDILTKDLAKKGSIVMIANFNSYLVAIIKSASWKEGKPLTLSEVEDMPLRDKHFILLRSRMHSIGDIVEIKHKCQDEECGCESTYDIDLKDYDADFKDPNLTYGGSDDLRVRPYKDNSTHFEVEVPSGKKVRLNKLNGKGELYILQQQKSNTLRSSADILSRFPQVYSEDEGEWVSIKSLNIFSKKDAITLKKAILTEDEQMGYEATVKCENCNRVSVVPLLMIADFFFPEEI